MEGCGNKSESFFGSEKIHRWLLQQEAVSQSVGEKTTSRGGQRGARGKIHKKKSREWTNVTIKKVRLSASVVLVVDRTGSYLQ